jgi:hypothetical protein
LKTDVGTENAPAVSIVKGKKMNKKTLFFVDI